MSPPRRRSARLRAAHGFFGRQGGVSPAPYDALNAGAGSGDAPANVAENRRRVAEALGADALVTAYQTHSAEVAFAEGPWEGDAPRADAVVTDRPGLAVGVLAADCVPVLFEALLPSGAGGLVAAAHAGWRGSLGGVLEATVAALESRGADRDRIACAVGPCLRAEGFEVGDDLIEALTARYPEADRFLLPAAAPGKHLYDHAGFVRWRLEAAGVPAHRVDDVGGNTLSRREGYFSYRGSQRAGEADYGRNLSAICLPAPRPAERAT